VAERYGVLARLVFTPFVVVVGGKYFWPGAKMPIFNLMVRHFFICELI
jgi:hypothetical protein